MFHANFAWKFSFHGHGDKFSNKNDFGLKGESQRGKGNSEKKNWVCA